VGRVTLQTIADRVGVSRMTVSNAFSRPDQLSVQLRDRIMGVADELGYVGPDPAGRALAMGTSGAIGLLLSETPAYALTDEVAMAFLAGIADELTPTGLALTLLSAAPQTGVIPARDVALDGAIVYSCDTASNALSWLMRRRLPLVFVDQDPVAGIASINVADRLGARAAAEHLTGLGHRHLAIVTSGFNGAHGVLTSTPRATLAHTEQQRLLGWTEGAAAVGAEPIVVRLPHGNPYDVGYEAGLTILGLSPRPTGILCFSDASAQGVLDAVTAAGLRVPADLSVVGFDDNPLSRRTQPALTTIRQDVDAKGRAAASALLAATEGAKSGRSKRAKHIVLPTELIVRASTAHVPRRRS
jgi:DNA-binding LacI/PurR family transcriptional regulator